MNNDSTLNIIPIFLKFLATEENSSYDNSQEESKLTGDLIAEIEGTDLDQDRIPYDQEELEEMENFKENFGIQERSGEEESPYKKREL